MSALRLAVLVVAGTAACCVAKVLTHNPNTPEHVQLANIVVERLQAPLIAAVEEVKALVQDSCGGAQMVDVPAPFPPSLPDPAIADLTTKIQTMDDALHDAIRKIDVLEAKLEEKTEPLATTAALNNLKNSITRILDDTMRYVESQVDDMLKKEEVEEVVRGQVEGVKEAVREAQETCGSDLKMTELIHTVREVNENVEQVKVEAEATKGKVEQCVAQNATEEVRGVGVKVAEVVSKVEGLRDALEVELQDIASRVKEISNTTQLLATTPPPPPPQEEQEQEEAPVYPCLDSTFIGTTSAKICQTAVRFKRCFLPLVSYHCCYTCTSQGQLPEMGEWRHLQLPRKVTALQVFSFFTQRL